MNKPRPAIVAPIISPAPLRQGYCHRDQPASRSRLRAARTANSGRVVTSATECSGLSAIAGGGFGYVRGDFLRGELFAVRLADVAVWLAVAASCVFV